MGEKDRGGGGEGSSRETAYESMSQKLPRKLVTLPSSVVMIYYRLKNSILKTALASSNSKVIVLKRCIIFCFVKKKFKKKKNIGNISTDSPRRQSPSFLQ